MRTLIFTLATLLIAAFAFGGTATLDVVNSECPVTGMAVKEGMTVAAKGGEIGVCCGKCKVAVAAWSDDKKAEFVANAGAAKADDKKPAKDEAKDGAWAGEPYLLDICAASGRPIDVKGTPTTKVVGGIEMKFCCGGCASYIEKDPSKINPKVAAALTAQQLPIYPTETCVISGEPLMEKNDKGEMAYIGTDVVVGNRLFRVCCKMCAKKVKSEPAAFAAKLDEMAMKAQGEGYALEACVVNDKGPIDTKKAKSFVMAGRVVKTCCGSCEAKVREEPMKYIPKIDAALAAARAKSSTDAAPKKEAVKEAAKKAIK